MIEMVMPRQMFSDQEYIIVPTLLCTDCGLKQEIGKHPDKKDKLAIWPVHTKECKYASKD